MKLRTTLKTLAAGALAFGTLSASAATWPLDAICRNDIAPGKYHDNGPYDYDDYDMPLFSTPGGATVYYPTQANDYVAEIALAFQKAYLDGDLRWAPFIEEPPFDVWTYEEANIPNY